MTLPYHRWPRAYGGWQAGSIIECEGVDCQWCRSRWTLVDPNTLEDMSVERAARELAAREEEP